MLIFFDTEFTDLHWQARLISIGLIAEDGRTFYAELSDTYQVTDCGDFAREVVLPLLDGGDSRMALPTLSLRLGNWIEGLEQPVTLATDSLAWDWPWIQKFFEEPGTWPVNLAGQPLLLNMNYLADYDKFDAAIAKAFADGLRRHHSLDDAKANRLGWIEAGGDIEMSARGIAVAESVPDAGVAAEQKLSETDWWKRVVDNGDRMAVDEEYRKRIAKDLS